MELPRVGFGTVKVKQTHIHYDPPTMTIVKQQPPAQKADQGAGVGRCRLAEICKDKGSRQSAVSAQTTGEHVYIARLTK